MEKNASLKNSKDVEKYLSQLEMEKKDEQMAIRLQKELSGA